MTDPLGQSQVLPYIAGLTKEGYQFHLISFEKSDRFKQHKKHIQAICDQSEIHWHPQDYRHKGGPFGTRDLVKRMEKVALYLHEIHNFSIVHCRSYIPALVGLRFQKKGVKFVFDMRGFWADERVDGGLWSLKHPIYRTIYRFFKRKEKEFLNKADAVISLTENGQKEILSWPTTPKEIAITVIPCCVNLDLFDRNKVTQESKLQLKKELNINENQFVLGYVGSIGTWYMLPEMLGCFKQLRAQKPDAVFLFVTGEKPEVLKTMASSQGIDPDALRVVSVLHDRVPEMIALMDASVFFIRPTFSKKASSPTKQGEIMAMGIPLICNSNVGDTDEIVARFHSGIVVNDFSDEAYTEAFSNLKGFDPESIAAGAKTYFSLEEGVRRYSTVYQKILG